MAQSYLEKAQRPASVILHVTKIQNRLDEVNSITQQDRCRLDEAILKLNSLGKTVVELRESSRQSAAPNNGATITEDAVNAILRRLGGLEDRVNATDNDQRPNDLHSVTDRQEQDIEKLQDSLRKLTDNVVAIQAKQLQHLQHDLQAIKTDLSTKGNELRSSTEQRVQNVIHPQTMEHFKSEWREDIESYFQQQEVVLLNKLRKEAVNGSKRDDDCRSRGCQDESAATGMAENINMEKHGQVQPPAVDASEIDRSLQPMRTDTTENSLQRDDESSTESPLHDLTTQRERLPTPQPLAGRNEATAEPMQHTSHSKRESHQEHVRQTSYEGIPFNKQPRTSLKESSRPKSPQSDASTSSGSFEVLPKHRPTTITKPKPRGVDRTEPQVTNTRLAAVTDVSEPQVSDEFPTASKTATRGSSTLKRSLRKPNDHVSPSRGAQFMPQSSMLPLPEPTLQASYSQTFQEPVNKPAGWQDFNEIVSALVKSDQMLSGISSTGIPNFLASQASSNSGNESHRIPKVAAHDIAAASQHTTSQSTQSLQAFSKASIAPTASASRPRSQMSSSTHNIPSDSVKASREQRNKNKVAKQARSKQVSARDTSGHIETSPFARPSSPEKRSYASGAYTVTSHAKVLAEAYRPPSRPPSWEDSATILATPRRTRRSQGKALPHSFFWDAETHLQEIKKAARKRKTEDSQQYANATQASLPNAGVQATGKRRKAR